MQPHEWKRGTDSETARKRAGGRRRYNAMRQRRAKARRAAMDEVVGEIGVAAFVTPGLAPALARAFGVSRQTAWRDLQQILYGPREHNFYGNGELLFTIYRAYPGGPIVSLTDPDGNEIRGAVRRSILRQLPRYFG